MIPWSETIVTLSHLRVEIKKLDDYIDTTNIIPTDENNKRKSFNITRNERQAIDILANDTFSSIVIKEADKGEAL